MKDNIKFPTDPATFAIIASQGHWRPYKHLLPVIELSMYVAQGKITRTMIFMPPRHGKSKYISEYFLSWYLGNFPDHEIIFTSHTQNFSEDWSKSVRSLLKQQGQNLFLQNITISKDKSGVQHWKIKGHQGGLKAVGTGGTIVGYGANGMIVDDPVNDYIKINSESYQQKLNDWWYTSADTRLNKDLKTGRYPWVIGIWQRLHIKDLAGQILEKEPSITYNDAIKILRNGGSIPHDTWVILNLPALSEDPKTDPLHRPAGTPLWKEQLNKEELLTKKNNMGSFRFNALYQGNPKVPEGHILHRGWFKKMPYREMYEKTKHLPKLRYWDLAASGEEGDECANILSTYDGINLYLLKLMHGGLTPEEVNNLFKSTLQYDTKKTICKIEQEPASSPKILIDRLRADNPGYIIFADPVSGKGNKATRAWLLAAMAQNGQVYIADTCYDACVDQAAEFTGKDGNKDDIVDCMSGSANHWVDNDPSENKILVGY